MKVLTVFPPELAARVQGIGFTPIQCDCGTVMGWHESRGKVVVCPECNALETVELKPVTPADADVH